MNCIKILHYALSGKQFCIEFEDGCVLQNTSHINLLLFFVNVTGI